VVKKEKQVNLVAPLFTTDALRKSVARRLFCNAGFTTEARSKGEKKEKGETGFSSLSYELRTLNFFNV
jgi:hypothetical protein